MKRTWIDDRLVRTRLAAGLVAAFVLAAPAAASASPTVLHAGDSARTAGQVSNYWTPKRMENATPVGPLKVRPAPNEQAAGERSEAPVPQAGPVAYTSFELTDTLSFPNRVHGKVFFTRPGLGNFVCSGTAVDAVNLSTVITAGHCVHYDGAWSTNFEFVPGYPAEDGNGDPIYGEWPATDEAAPSSWVSSENFKYDVGAVVVATNSSGQSLEDVVGAREVVFNQPTNQPYQAYGYPQNSTAQHPTWNGTELWECDSAPPIADDPGGSGPDTLGIGCDMSPGSSGGGWVLSSSNLNGVNSYKYSGQPEVMYGPYFGTAIESLYLSVQAVGAGGTGTPTAGSATALPQNAAPIATAKKCKKKTKKKYSGKKKRCKTTR